MSDLQNCIGHWGNLSVFKRSSRRVTVVAVACLLIGCAETRIREESQVRIEAGNYESAMQLLSDGLKQYPESVPLRTAFLQTRASAVASAISAATALRSSGKTDEAEAALKRAKLVDPDNQRVAALLLELAVDRRQGVAVAEAERWVAKQRPDMALRTIEAALKDNPQHQGLLALQRRVGADQRAAQVRAAQPPLADARPISLDFRDANLRTVLDVVSRNSGINFVLDRDIRADTRITVYLREAGVLDALDLIASTNQLARKVVDGKTILIYPNTPEKQREYQEQIVRVFHMTNADAKGAAAFLKSMLKIRDPFVDERSNMLSLRESQENIQLAERLIALYDSSEPEVMLDVEILEVASTRLTELGVKFPSSFSLTPLAPDGSDALTLGNIRGLNRNRLALDIGGITVNLRREVGDFTTLANPKIRARNKAKAKIMIGDKIPVVTATTGLAGFVADSVSYLDVGLKLEVEPTVYSNDDVAITLALEVSALGTAVKTNSGTLAYQVSTRNTSTLLRLRDGETQVLAGLISRDERSSASRVPGIGDLPVLGRLFSDQLDNTGRNELVLAITPRVLRNIQRPDAGERELWVGTEAQPRLRVLDMVPANPAAEATSSADASNAVATGANAVPGVAPTAVPSSVSAVAAVSPEARPQSVPTEQARVGANPPIFAWSGPSEVQNGDVVELKLTLNSALPLRGVPMTFKFDSTKLQLTEVLEGEFFRKGAATTSFTNTSDAATGTINVGLLRNQGNGASGQGTVVTLRFKATGPGKSEVRLVNAPGIGVEASAPAIALPPPFLMQAR